MEPALLAKFPIQRISGVTSAAPYSTLPPGPFQLTGKNFPYDSYAASPVHRFYQMWQQEDCNVKYATRKNPSGCKADLFTWTEVTVGSNVNGAPQPSNFSRIIRQTAKTTGEGATAMGFYNMLEGDAPYTKYLADNYAISDNYHQPAMGGTGLDSIMLFFGDAIWFSDENGQPGYPPHNEIIWAWRDPSMKSKIQTRCRARTTGGSGWLRRLWKCCGSTVFTAAALTATARTPRSQASDRF